MYPSGTLTFLFSDLEESSRLWELYPEEMHPTLARHDAILREAVETNQGLIVKGTGDGLHAVFMMPGNALQAAVDALRSLTTQNWGSPGPLRVRLGLHTGQANLRDGDYYGPAVNRAARVMSVAAGGQILLSMATAELVRDLLPDGASLADLGQHRLRSLDRPERLFQLQHPALTGDFPPLKSVQDTPNNLPLQLNSFIGRETEIIRIRQLLTAELQKDGQDSPAGINRLVTLVGPGGTGKTRLSLQVAEEVSEDYPDGVWLIELAPLGDPDLIVQAMAEPLGLREQPGRPLLAMLADYLRSRKILLILDNCEHIIDGCARVAQTLLQSCPHLFILASSREALGIAGERPFRVRSLALPAADRHFKEGELAASEGIQLFLTRAKTVKNSFSLTEENGPVILQICHRLDGIPLAIELAAARVRVLTPEQILDRLDDRFRLLTGGSRTALPRQRTLQALIDWSYDLLSETERILLRRLSVFSGGWHLEAAENVTAADPLESFEILDLLEQLHNKSLIVANEGELGMRYSMLETIRQYAQEKLAQSDEVDQLRERHLAFFVKQHEAAARATRNLQIADWGERLAGDHDNYRAARAWALENDLNSALRLTAGITARWGLIFPPPEMFHFVETVIESAKQHPEYAGPGASGENRRLLATALASAANLSLLLGIARTRDLASRAETIAREQEDIPTLAAALASGSVASGAEGDFSTMFAQHQELNLLMANLDHPWLQAIHLVSYGADILSADENRIQKAWDNWERGMAMFRQNGEIWGLAFGHQLASGAAFLLKDPDRAQYHAERSVEINEELGDVYEINAPRSKLADLARQRGDLEEAIPLYKEVIAGWRNVGQFGAMARCLECLAFIGRAQAQATEEENRSQWLAHSATLLGAADALRQAKNSQMNAFERPEYEQELTTIRSLAGDDRFHIGSQRGRAMDPDQVVAFIQEL